jgi:hypothetical protein
MAQYVRTQISNEGIKMFAQLLSDKFRDFVCHTGHCRDVNEGVKFLLSLPFVSGTSVENMSCPSHIYVNIVPFASEVCVLIGGQLSADENCAVRSLAAARGTKTESICRADEGTPVRRCYLEAMAKLQEKSKPEKKPPTRSEKQTHNEQAQARWYYAQNDGRHVRQVVISFPVQASVPPPVGNLVCAGSFMTEPWATTVLPILGKGGPFIFAKADGVVEMLKQEPVTVAFAFYRFSKGGLFQTFVHADSPDIRAKAGCYYLAGDPRWPGSQEDKQTIDALLDLDTLELCFCASGDKGPCTGYFGLAACLPVDCRATLMREWEDLVAYHHSLDDRSLDACVDQYFRENPNLMEELPIAPEHSTDAWSAAPASRPLPDAQARPAVEPQVPPKKRGRRWWEFWR